MKTIKRLSSLLILALVILSSGCASTGAQVWIPMESEGKQYKLEAELYLPEGKTGPFPVVVFSHGSGAMDFQFSSHSYAKAINFFLEEMGYAVVFFYRRGYSRSDGPLNEPPCNRNTNESGLRAAGKDMEAVLEYVKKNPILDSSRIVLSGTSRGAFLSTMAGAFIPEEGIRGVVSFAGVWEGCFPGFNQAALKFTAGGRKVRNLWIYSQGDTFTNETRARAYADTFRGVGGDVELKMYPSFAGGHNVRNFPNYWRGDVRQFLESVMK